MTDVSAILNNTRSAASFLVDREERSTGSRMLAYEKVGRAIGASASWVRKFLGNQECGLSYAVGIKIVQQFEGLQSRVDEDNRERAERAATLRHEIHASTPRIIMESLASDTGASAATAPLAEEEARS